MLFDSLVKPALDSVTKVIDEFHLSPEDKVKRDQAIQDAYNLAQKQADDTEVSLNKIASDNIQADAKSGDKFTQRARPLFLYIVNGILAWDYIVTPLLQGFHVQVPFLPLPGDLLTLFGIGITGYAFARSAEKIAAMPGDSKVSALGVFSAQNKS